MNYPHKLRMIVGGRGDGPRILKAPIDDRPLWRRCVTPIVFALIWLATMVPIAFGLGGYVLLAALCIWVAIATYDLAVRLMARRKRAARSASAP